MVDTFYFNFVSFLFPHLFNLFLPFSFLSLALFFTPSLLVKQILEMLIPLPEKTKGPPWTQLNHQRASFKPMSRCSVSITTDTNEGIWRDDNVWKEQAALLYKRVQAVLGIYLVLSFLYNSPLLQIQHENMPVLICFHWNFQLM